MAYIGAASLGMVTASSVTPWVSHSLLYIGAIGGFLTVLPQYAAFVLALALVERRVLIPPRPPGEAARRAWILAVPAFPHICWVGFGWLGRASLGEAYLLIGLAFAAYAHGARLVYRTGHGARVLGVGAIAFGGLIAAGAVASLRGRPADGLFGILEGFTFPGARVGMGIYGGILAWNGYWLLRARQDKA